MDDEQAVDDSIATALLSDSAFERRRADRYRLFDQPIPRKLAWQSLILAALAMVLPLAVTLPASTRALFPGGSLLWAAPKILLLGAWAGALEAVAAVGLTYVAVRRLRQGESLTDREIEHLLNVEDVASMVSLVTGTAAVVAVDAFFLLGHGGGDAMRAFLAAGGENPFAATAIPVTVVGVAAPAAALAVLLFGASRVFADRLPR